MPFDIQQASRQFEKNKKAKVFTIAFFVFIGMSSAILYSAIQNFIFEQSYPFNTFLFGPNDRFNDFLNTFDYFRLGKAPGMGGSTFSVFLIFSSLQNMFESRIMALSVYSTLIVLFFLFYSKEQVKSIASFTSVQQWLLTILLGVLSYPVIFALDRGNPEPIAFIYLVYFLYSFRSKKFALGAIMLALAIDIKVYPFIFSILLVSEKRFKELFYLLIFYMLIASVGYDGSSLQFALFDPASYISSASSTSNSYNISYAIGNSGLAFGSSLFGGIKAIMIWLNIANYDRALQTLFASYFSIMVIFFAIIVIFTLFIEQIFWKKVALLTFAMLLCPFVTADYRLIHVFHPLWLFLKYKPLKFDRYYVILFGLLLVPKSYIEISEEVSISVILNPLIMLVMTILILSEGASKTSAKMIKARARSYFYHIKLFIPRIVS